MRTWGKSVWARISENSSEALLESAPGVPRVLPLDLGMILLSPIQRRALRIPLAPHIALPLAPHSALAKMAAAVIFALLRSPRPVKALAPWAPARIEEVEPFAAAAGGRDKVSLPTTRVLGR